MAATNGFSRMATGDQGLITPAGSGSRCRRCELGALPIMRNRGLFGLLPAPLESLLRWIALVSLVLVARAEPPFLNVGTPWPATDALGRKLPSFAEVGPPKPERFTGIFYFLWHNPGLPKHPNWEGPYDVS